MAKCLFKEYEEWDLVMNKAKFLDAERKQKILKLIVTIGACETYTYLDTLM